MPRLHPEGTYEEVERCAQALGRPLTDSEIMVLGWGIARPRVSGALTCSRCGLWLERISTRDAVCVEGQSQTWAEGRRS